MATDGEPPCFALIEHSGRFNPTEMMTPGTPSGVFDADGREIRIGDMCIPVRGPYSDKRHKGRYAVLVWKAPMLCWRWDDGYVNVYPTKTTDNWKVLEGTGGFS